MEITQRILGGLVVSVSVARYPREGGVLGVIAPSPSQQRPFEVEGLPGLRAFTVFENETEAQATVAFQS